MAICIFSSRHFGHTVSTYFEQHDQAEAEGRQGSLKSSYELAVTETSMIWTLVLFVGVYESEEVDTSSYVIRPVLAAKIQPLSC